jgi:hypothetical protein
VGVSAHACGATIMCGVDGRRTMSASVRGLGCSRALLLLAASRACMHAVRPEEMMGDTHRLLGSGWGRGQSLCGLCDERAARREVVGALLVLLWGGD